MADNDAAKANFEELKGHIDLASKRIKALQPGTENYNQSVEDLEDYYERTIQLRKMQAETALRERDEAQQNAFKTKYFLFLIICILALFIVIEFVWLAPEAADYVWNNAIKPYATIDRLVMAAVTTCALLIHWFKR